MVSIVTTLKIILFNIVFHIALGRPTYQTKWIEQKLDHFRFDNNGGTFKQRYLYNDEYWNIDGAQKKSKYFNDLPGNCPGPILFYSGNEGPIDAFWNSNGFMQELAQEWNGLLIFGEHRYYGLSLPFGTDSLSPKNAVYLSTEQALADYAYLLTELKNNILGENATECPVISFGGSYGGTLTTYFRLKYPQVVIGGLAASAPIGYYSNSGWKDHGVDQYTWIDIVNKVYDEAHPECLDTLQDTVTLLGTKGSTVAGRKELAEIFHLCNPLDDAQPLVNWFTDAIETIPQMNYPYAIGTMPAWPVNATCNIMLGNEARSDAKNSSALLYAAAQISDFYYSRMGTNCVSGDGQGGIPGGGPGPASWGSWSYQSCTETLHQFSARGLRNFQFNMNDADKTCEKYFNVQPRPEWTELHFGGYAIGDGLTGVTNLIFSNGLLDPWHGGGFLTQKNDKNHVLIMEKGAHHLDLRGSNDADPPGVTKVRDMERKIMENWIHEYIRVNRNDGEL